MVAYISSKPPIKVREYFFYARVVVKFHFKPRRNDWLVDFFFLQVAKGFYRLLRDVKTVLLSILHLFHRETPDVCEYKVFLYVQYGCCEMTVTWPGHMTDLLAYSDYTYLMCKQLYLQSFCSEFDERGIKTLGISPGTFWQLSNFSTRLMFFFQSVVTVSSRCPTRTWQNRGSSAGFSTSLSWTVAPVTRTTATATSCPCSSTRWYSSERTSPKPATI